MWGALRVGLVWARDVDGGGDCGSDRGCGGGGGSGGGSQK
jgi:hypothetical protein